MFGPKGRRVGRWFLAGVTVKGKAYGQGRGTSHQGMLTEDQRHQVREWARESDVRLVVLFGSQARTGRGKDVDLAVDATRGDRMSSALSLAARLERSDLDVAWLPTGSWLLHSEVARDGQLLFENRAGRFEEFRLTAALRRADAGIWRRRDQEFIRRSLKRDSSVNTELVTRKLARLLQYLRELEPVLTASEAEFVAQPTLHYTAERLLELLIEGAAAINTELAQALAGMPPSDYYSSFFSVTHTGWVDAEVARPLAELARVRNVLVHQYEDVDLGVLYHKLTEALPNWRAYAETIGSKL